MDQDHWQEITRGNEENKRKCDNAPLLAFVFVLLLYFKLRYMSHVSILVLRSGKKTWSVGVSLDELMIFEVIYHIIYVDRGKSLVAMTKSRHFFFLLRFVMI